ncbi:1331_t:CDS:1 [Dentiscutata heterogama]|uniref:1331_t:CDS:1 n=1 Tax=Dentiscutata heterogama TaxID=1316150 RepID=A0ACA9JZZ0_9GLOM|nr:1331_t:CDS:1 [Dentiscutata heterogama]
MSSNKTTSIINGRNVNTSSKKTSTTSSSDRNAGTSNNTNSQTSQTSQTYSSRYLSYYDSANFANTTRDDSYASFLFLGEEFPPVKPLQDQLINDMISKLQKNE